MNGYAEEREKYILELVTVRFNTHLSRYDKKKNKTFHIREEIKMKVVNRTVERDFFDRFIETSLKKGNMPKRKGRKTNFGIKCLYSFAGMIYLTVVALVLL